MSVIDERSVVRDAGAVHTAAAGSAARADRLVGKVMLVVGVVSMIVGAAGAIVAALLISSLRSSVDDSLQLTDETLETASDSITLSASILDTLRLSITSVSDALEAVQTSVETSSTTLTDVGAFMSGPLSTTLQSVSDVFPTLESTAGAIDETLALLSRVPFGPDYAPEVPFSETIGGLGDAIEPLPEQLRVLNADFAEVETSASEVSSRLDDVIADVDALTERLDGIDELLDRYAATALDAQDLAADSRGELDRNATLGLVLAVLIGLLAIASQIVPLWLGKRLSTGRFAWPVAPPLEEPAAVRGHGAAGLSRTGHADDDVEGVQRVESVEIVDVVGPATVTPTTDATDAADVSSPDEGPSAPQRGR